MNSKKNIQNKFLKFKQIFLLSILFILISQIYSQTNSNANPSSNTNTNLNTNYKNNTSISDSNSINKNNSTEKQLNSEITSDKNTIDFMPVKIKDYKRKYK